MMEEESDEEFEGGVVVGQIPTVSVPRHIKKRALKNKALAVGFNEKDLWDFVGGFHKRKKKRRKEAQKQIQEKDRKKRIEARKKRKEAREFAQYGEPSENPSAPGSEPDVDIDGEEGELNSTEAISETKTYESSCTTITVTTSELKPEDDDPRPTRSIPIACSMPEKNKSLSVKKKPMKRAKVHKSKKKARKPTLQKKDRWAGKSKR